MRVAFAFSISANSVYAESITYNNLTPMNGTSAFRSSTSCKKNKKMSC